MHAVQCAFDVPRAVVQSRDGVPRVSQLDECRGVPDVGRHPPCDVLGRGRRALTSEVSREQLRIEIVQWIGLSGRHAGGVLRENVYGASAPVNNQAAATPDIGPPPLACSMRTV